MRKVVLQVAMSLDGLIARPDGSVDFLFMPKDFPMGPFMAAVDSAVMGRKTYEVAMRLSGGKMPGPGMKYYVFSRTHAPGESGPVTFVAGSPPSFVAGLRKSPGKDIWLMGGGELARAFLKEDLVDEIHLSVLPLLLGSGIPLFLPGFPQRNFSLSENRSFAGGVVYLKYVRA